MHARIPALNSACLHGPTSTTGIAPMLALAISHLSATYQQNQ
jgi:hypothetical protein